MSRDWRQVSDAVLHEGALLYPYHASALKNRQHYPFGTLYPERFCRTHQAGDSAFLQLECLVTAPVAALLELRLRFLQMLPETTLVREVAVPTLSLDAVTRSPARVPFAFPDVQGTITVSAAEVRDGVLAIRVRLANDTDLAGPRLDRREDALMHSLASPHLLVSITGGEFASLIDPPASLQDLAAGCRNIGTWPVLIGNPGTTDRLLAAPIVLYDYPEIAPESPGDFFDGTEMDEMLTLRILTLSDGEKAAIAAAGNSGSSILERTEALGLEQLRTLHGTFRNAPPGPGTQVRLHPRGRADIWDVALEGRLATVSAVERDLEGRTYIAVTINDDPGSDLGAFGHRFFFRADELEIL